MKKKIFYGFSFFVFLFTMVVWQFAAAELAELQDEPRSNMKNQTSEIA
ncbi:hypothetical protein [Salinimicrobium flavum]|uniref:Uncharacterized protein n=1 Tax=Salinimicrobium flavum TaxID=1737065 RepID=A0ABW5IWH2_9FLAO